MEMAVGFGEEIVQFDFGVWRDARETVTDSAGGAVMPFAIARGQDQDFFHVTMSILREAAEV